MSLQRVYTIVGCAVALVGALAVLCSAAERDEVFERPQSKVLSKDAADPAVSGRASYAFIPSGEKRPLSARPPGLSGDPETAKIWERGLRFEAEDQFVASSQTWEAIVERRPQESHTYWRIARNYLRYAQNLPPSDMEKQVHFYSLTEEWSDRGVQVDPSCAECYLYKFAGLGRRIALGNLFSAARRASELASLLERAMALHPTYRDNEWNSELGNLYYAAAAFYRVLPEWGWLKWVIGVRGDRRRSLSYIRKANEISKERIDYHLALGASLLCLGSDEREMVSEGVEVLRRIPSLPTRLETDPTDRRIAEALLSEPQRACGYTHHDWIDIDKEFGKG